MAMWPFRAKKPDARGGRVVLLIGCLLNQNARDLGAAQSPAMVGALVELLSAREVGMVQIPCPEIASLGFARRRAPGERIRDALSGPGPAACWGQPAMATADRIQCYLDQGYQVLAVLGGNEESPGCAVHAAEDSGGRLAERSGVFMLALAAELERRGLCVPFRGMRDADPKGLEEDLDWLRQRL
jgi:predicted secreted protein